ncbi:MAG TPA: HDOD domain-containing protein, partial [Gammaproteobacteria bacterium]|nr:HDOD domain-containing protein [Gammaproteobacteria bacterium]
VANSPLLRASRATDSLEGAVTRLGMKLVRDMATSIVMEQMFQATSDITDRKLREVWEHSTQVAAIAHALASQFTPLKPEEAMLAGLVHDIGKLPLLTKAEEQPEILEDEDALDQLLWRLHPRIGGVILRAWGFPEALAAVAEQHEKLDREVPEADYVDVVTVANLQAHMGGDHPHADADWDKVPAVHRLGLNPEVSVIEMDETAAEIEEVESLLRS